MQTKHLRDRSPAAKARWYGEVQPCRICVGEIVEAERGLVTEDPCRLVAPVTGPEHPEDQVRSVWFGEARQSVDSTMFASPITCTDVVDPFIAGVSERGCLLRSEVATLRFRELVEIFLPLKWRLGNAHKRSTLWTYYAGRPDSNASPCRYLGLIPAVCSGRWRLIARQPMRSPDKTSVELGFNRSAAASNHLPTLAGKALPIAMCQSAARQRASSVNLLPGVVGFQVQPIVFNEIDLG